MKPYPKIFPVGHLVPKNPALFKMLKLTEWAMLALMEFVVQQVVVKVSKVKVNNQGYLPSQHRL